MPDNPLPRPFSPHALLFCAQECWAWETMFKVGRSPAGKCIGYHLPGDFKPSNQFGRLAHQLPLFIPVRYGNKIGIPCAHPLLEPPGADGDHMGEKPADRPMMGR